MPSAREEAEDPEAIRASKDQVTGEAAAELKDPRDAKVLRDHKGLKVRKGIREHKASRGPETTLRELKANKAYRGIRAGKA